MSAYAATLSLCSPEIRFTFAGPGMSLPGRALFVALRLGTGPGCSVIPYRHNREGSTVFLPRTVDHLFAVLATPNGPVTWQRRWKDGQWCEPSTTFATGQSSVDRLLLRLPSDDPAIRNWSTHVADNGPIVWAKDVPSNHGWGAVIPHRGGPPEWILGDCALSEQGLLPLRSGTFELRWRKPAPLRPRIYQLFPRLFSNINETRKPHGTAVENGVGKFGDITTNALTGLRTELHITHLWLTGVLAHATATAFPEIGKPADDPNLLKGKAGSPYAIRDYGDVSAELATDPAKRMEEFKALVQRAHACGLQVLIDFVPNHVARSHHSTLVEFGRLDDTSRFFDPGNNFFWLRADSPGGGPPLRLPSAVGDTPYEPEQRAGRVTGNNAVTWAPSRNDWYETAKLNYGYDFTTHCRSYPHAGAPDLPIPDTWKKVDAVLAYWQGFGIDGFRCDMAHMIPPEFWQWALARARERNRRAYFIAEAYNDDPMKVESGDPLLRGFGSVSLELMNAGFDAVYDAPAYKTLKRIYDGGAWANDVDIAAEHHGKHGAIFDRGLRYAENHDEVRIASRHEWAGIGMEVGRPVSAILFALGRGPVLIYNGQEVGEPAVGAEGFGGDDSRTTIFDYWSMPELCKWVNDWKYDGGRLAPEQHNLRAYYGRLLGVLDDPPLRDGDFILLNRHNVANPDFGRMPDEHVSGHWLYAFLRRHPDTGEAYLVVANLHRHQLLTNIRIWLPPAVGQSISASILHDRLSGVPAASVSDSCVFIRALPALTPAYFHIPAYR